MKLQNIDKGKEFDWGKTSSDYSKFRDIYPNSMYEKLYDLGIGQKNQNILDFGTGTGVFPRATYKYGANFTGVDISKEQIEYAKKLSKNMNILYKNCPAEETGLNSNEYDVITAIQCFIYFNKEKIAPEIKRLLKKDGKMVIVWMAWLPNECKTAEETEKLVLKYNPKWTGAGNPRSTDNKFMEFLPELLEAEKIINYTEDLEFNYESWAGRIRACRGVSASLPENVVNDFNEEHLKLLKNITPEPFKILHEIRLGIYKLKS